MELEKIPKNGSAAKSCIFHGFHRDHYKINIPGTCLSSILVVVTLQNKVFSNQNKGYLGSRYIYTKTSATGGSVNP